MEMVFLLSENRPTYIPVGVVHTLENPGETPLEIIEVRSVVTWVKMILFV